MKSSNYLVTCLLTIFGGLLMAQEDQEAMMAAYMQSIQPGEEHAFLAKSVGEFDYKMKTWMAPGEEAMETSGTCTYEMDMGGRYLIQKTSASMMGMQMSGMGTSAYDNYNKEYVSTWIDNMGTGIMVFKGQRDGNVLTQFADYNNPMTGQMEKVRAVVTMVDENSHTFDYYVTSADGEEHKQMEISYTRKM